MASWPVAGQRGSTKGRRTAVAVVVAVTLLATCGAARAYPPLEAAPLAPGQWTFVFGQQLGDYHPTELWLPAAGYPVDIWVRGLLPRPERAVRGSHPLELRLRYQSPREPCGRSFDDDGGSPLRSIAPVPSAQGFVQRWDAKEGAGSLVGGPGDLDGSGRPALLVCGWVGYSADQQVQPVSEVIPLLYNIFGAAAIQDGSANGFIDLGWNTEAASTNPFSSAEIDGSCNGFPPTTGPLMGPAGHSILGGLGVYDTGEGTLGCPGATNTYTFTSPTLGQYTVAFPADAALAPGAATAHAGNGCVLDTAWQTVAEMTASTEAQGCHVGQVFAGPKQAFEPTGSVYSAVIHGAEVQLAPQDTTVDLVTSGAPPLISVPSPGGGTLTQPVDGQCSTLSSLSPKFGSAEHKLVQLRALSSKTLEVSISAGITLGSVGVCDRSIDDLVPGLDVRNLSFSLGIQYSLSGHVQQRGASYSFAPLGWHPPHHAGAGPARPPSIQWSSAVSFGGSASPNVSFTYTPGEPLEPTLDLISVPVLQPAVTLVRDGRAILQVGLGPQLSFGLSFDRKELAEQEDEDVAEGESPEAAAEEISQELGDDVGGAVQSEGSALAPESAAAGEALGGDAVDITDAMSAALDAELPTDATVIAAQNAADSSLLAADGLTDAAIDGGVDAVVGDQLIEVVGIIIIAEDHRHPVPADLTPTHGRLLTARRLAARPIRRLRPRSLHRAPFPRRRIPALVRARLPVTVGAQVGRLAVSATRLHAGHRLTVVAPFLGDARQAQLMLTGPNYRAVRMLTVAHGTAGAIVALPRRMAPGTWTISVIDRAGVSLVTGGHGLQGFAQVRMGVFTVRRARRRPR